MRMLFMVSLFSIMATSHLSAQDSSCKFLWKEGETITYRVDHQTTVAEVVGGNKAQTSSKLNLLKRWEVLGVDDQGVATLKLVLVAMRNEQVTPSKEILLFDSNDLEKSTPALKEHLQKFIGKSLAILRVDSLGKVLEAKEGEIQRYETDPPFGFTLPTQTMQENASWKREFTIVLPPPRGTGEKYSAEQSYLCKSIQDGIATIILKTTLKTPPESAVDQIPLFQKQPSGNIQFDTRTGRLVEASFRISRQLQDHQGAGSSYSFESVYSEQLVTPTKK